LRYDLTDTFVAHALMRNATKLLLS
jgi:hypothetical protein